MIRESETDFETERDERKYLAAILGLLAAPCIGMIYGALGVVIVLLIGLL